jgi:predicted dehydrogenase
MAVIGCGRIGNLHAQAIASSPRATLAALCDCDADRLARAAERYAAARYASVEELFSGERLDAVAIATPDHMHVHAVQAALAAGCHVFCEKPLADNLAEARQLVRAAAERGVQLAVDYNRRFGFGYRTAHRLLDEGTIGQLESCLLRVTDAVPPPAVARNRHVIFTTLLTHHFDLMRFFGGEIRSVYAVAGDGSPDSITRNVIVSLGFVSNALGTIAAGYRQNQSRTSEWMELSGSAGSLAIEDVTRRVTLVRLDADRREILEPDHFAAGNAFYDSLIDHLHAFIDHVAEGRESPVTGRDAVASLALAAAAIESLESGHAIEVPSA